MPTWLSVLMLIGGVIVLSIPFFADRSRRK